MNIEVFLGRLEAVRQEGTSWRAQCPACAGVCRAWMQGAVIMVRCEQGCPTEHVVRAAGFQLVGTRPLH